MTKEPRAIIADRKLEEALEGIAPEGLYDMFSQRDSRIEIRVSSDEKKTIDEMRNVFGLTTTEYLLRLHRFSRERLAACVPFATGQPLDVGDTEKSAERLREIVQTGFTGADGNQYSVSRLNVMGHSWRRFAVEMLKAASPEDHAEYKRLKYGQSGTPDLETRKRAYAFAVQRFLELTYTVPGY